MPPQNPNEQPSDNNSVNQPTVGSFPGQQFQPTNVTMPTVEPTQPATTPTPTTPTPQASWPPTDQQPFVTAPQKTGKKKFIVIAIIVGIIVAIAGSVYAFAFYIPSRPENIWNSGINRSGQALKGLVQKTSEQIDNESYAKSEVTLDVAASVQGQSFSGSINGKFDQTGTNSKLTLASNSDQIDLDLSADIISRIAEGQQLPDSYVRVQGLKKLAAMDLLPPKLSTFDNKWIAIEADYLESVLSPQEIEAQQEQLTSDDYNELANAALEPTLDRVFSTEPSKAVFENREFVGKEDVDGKSAYHYKVGINTANYVSYCKALVDSIMSTNAFTKTPYADKDNVESQKQQAHQSCDNIGEDVDPENVFDLWIDAKQKIIYKIRLTDEEQPGAYLDLGQNYDGGDNIEFFAHFHDNSSLTDAHVTLSTNIKDGDTTGKITVESKSEAFPYNMSITLNAKPYDGEIDTTTPQPTIPVEKVLRALGLN